MANKLISDLTAGAILVTDLLEHQPVAGPPSLKGTVTQLFSTGAGSLVINRDSRLLVDAAAVTAVDWANRSLVDSSNIIAMYWDGRVINDLAGLASFDGGNRVLVDSAGLAAFNWNTRLIGDSSGVTSIAGDTREMANSAGLSVLNWDILLLTDASNVQSLDWGNRILKDGIQLDSINYNLRQLVKSDATVVVDWENAIGIIDAAFIDQANRLLIDSSAATALNWENRQLFANDGATEALNWSDSLGVRFPVGIIDTLQVLSVDSENRLLIDSTAASSVDWETRQLIGPDGSTVVLDWNSNTVLDPIQRVFSTPTDPNGVVTATKPALCYGDDGSLWYKDTAGPDDTGWIVLISA